MRRSGCAGLCHASRPRRSRTSSCARGLVGLVCVCGGLKVERVRAGDTVVEAHGEVHAHAMGANKPSRAVIDETHTRYCHKLAGATFGVCVFVCRSLCVLMIMMMMTARGGGSGCAHGLSKGSGHGTVPFQGARSPSTVFLPGRFCRSAAVSAGVRFCIAFWGSHRGFGIVIEPCASADSSTRSAAAMRRASISGAGLASQAAYRSAF